MVEIIKQKFPIGMKIFLVYLGWSMLVLLYMLIFKFKLLTVAEIGPFFIKGNNIAPISIIAASLPTFVIFYGLLKRLKWVRIFAIIWFSVSTLMNGPVNSISFFLSKTLRDNYMNYLSSNLTHLQVEPSLITVAFIFNSIFATTVGLVILIYIYKKKDFFIN
jgi:hypothetical protein